MYVSPKDMVSLKSKNPFLRSSAGVNISYVRMHFACNYCTTGTVCRIAVVGSRYDAVLLLTVLSYEDSAIIRCSRHAIVTKSCMCTHPLFAFVKFHWMLADSALERFGRRFSRLQGSPSEHR